jgi:hypothetical protein
MADFARFRTISGPQESDETDEPVTLLNGSHRQFNVDLPDLDRDRGAVLMFQVSGTAGSHLQIVRQPGEHEQEIIKIDLDGTFTQPRSFHEMIQGRHLSENPQFLEMRASATPAGGQVNVSDLVLLYHAKTTP